MRPFLALAALTVVAGCSLGADPLTPPALAVAETPDLSRLAGKIQDRFKEAKLSGYPRVSRPRRAPISALGDWIVCLRSNGEDARIYALFIVGNEIFDFRLALQVDECGNETFVPLPP